jgi:purine nucleoside permease
MHIPNSTTIWRDKAIVPTDYEDLAGVVAVARKARGRLVEFDGVLHWRTCSVYAAPYTSGEAS